MCVCVCVCVGGGGGEERRGMAVCGSGVAFFFFLKLFWPSVRIVTQNQTTWYITICSRLSFVITCKPNLRASGIYKINQIDLFVIKNSTISATRKLSSANAFSLNKAKNLSPCKELKILGGPKITQK